MLSKNDQHILDCFASLVRERFPEAQIWAFGSRARGQATGGSDLDVCVVVDSLDDESDGAIIDTAWQVGFEHDLIISTVTYSREEFEKGPCAVSALVQNVLAEGVPA
jgi:predicted nucleotidyltransferase